MSIRAWACLANLVPDLVVDLVAAVHEAAPELPGLQRRVTELCDIYELTNPAPVGIKAAAHALGRLPRPGARVHAGKTEHIQHAADSWARRHQLVPTGGG